MYTRGYIVCLVAFHIFSGALCLSPTGRLRTSFLHPPTRYNTLHGGRWRLKSDGAERDSPYVYEFPALNRPESRNLVYFDNAATTQKPRAVIEAILDYYSNPCANVHRSQHDLATSASTRYESARHNVSSFINASSPSEIVFTSGATESINIVAGSWWWVEKLHVPHRDNVGPGDVILLPLSEHNSNIIPWQLHANDSGCRIGFIKLTEDGSVDLDDYNRLLDQGNVKLVSLAHASNVIGRVQDLSTIVRLAHSRGAKVLVDACQTLGHIPIDVSSIGCDFLVGSAHKMYGPTGVGFLYAKRSILDSMRPHRGGGGMVKNVTTTRFELEDVPHRFESGTPQVAQVIGFSAAIDFLRDIGLSKIAAYERELLSYLRDQLCKVATVYSPALDPNSDEHCPIVSFNVDGVSAFDIAALLATHNIAVRAGQHCAHILHRDYLKVDHSLRVSLALYNTRGEIDDRRPFTHGVCTMTLTRSLARLKSRSPYLGFFRNTPFYRRSGGDSILRVNPRLVPSKQLGKTLLRIGTLGMDRAKLERILITCATQMGQALDDVNLSTCLSLMVRLQISNPQCLESLVPYCYRISDLERAIACCHLIGMVPGSRDSPSARAFVVHVSQRVPLEGHSLLLRDLGRLCESLRVLDLYCEDLGEFLASVIEDELIHSESSEDAVYITSVLGYLGRMGVGSVPLWRLFSRYTATEGIHSNPRVLIKALESFCDRRIKHESLLNQAGDALALVLDSLRPSEVARVADVYSRLGFYHKRLAEVLILGAERVTPFLDASDSVKLLRTFVQAYSQPGTHAAITQDPSLSHRHRRALYLTFNRCTTGLK
ncbi:cysteine desulfurase, putative [Babesia bigemina]|uniref:cysteine desulfurase n=1 Tax=Babesia bigemina TaxID=5866 RepID=A0A061D2E3_BABBI|nr:cysteine desulfurase, putative [Babesia bigemina]CDR94768.1 cysteine desulfurase, putative [Babesia bigemina]|eukprot:XP_012766954.1 cysteine desulfurase, putative [Babesia bigemina]